MFQQMTYEKGFEFLYSGVQAGRESLARSKSILSCTSLGAPGSYTFHTRLYSAALMCKKKRVQATG